MKLNWFKKRERKEKYYFFIETKSFNSERRKVYYNRYVVTTDCSRFPYSEFEKTDGGAVIACFEVDARSAENCVNVKRLSI